MNSVPLPLWIVSAFSLFCLSGCHSEAASTVPHGYSPLKIGTATAYIKTAQTEEEHTTGLMYRRSLLPNSGMIFIYKKARPLSFWMKNTFVPLSIAFVRSDGVISEIHDMAPDDGRPDYLLPRYESKEPVPYAIEMEQGWFGKNGVATGIKLDLSNLPGIAYE